MLFFLLINVVLISAQNEFDQYFTEGGLRINFLHSGTRYEQNIEIKNFKKDPFWGGSKKNILPVYQFGTYKIEIFDPISDKLIFSSGYSTLFEEWITTNDAKTNMVIFEESVVIPFPQNKIKIVFSCRDTMNVFYPLYEMIIDPESILFEKNDLLNAKSYRIYYSGDYSQKVDLVILAEGYCKKEKKKFLNDAKKTVDFLFATRPYNKFEDRFNVYAVFIPSEDSGTDYPHLNIFKNTVLNSSYNTFGSERYLTTQSYFAVRDMASNVPYDQIIILVNDEGYGGGGIYNFYSLCTSDHKHASFLFNHEFGHAFAGLADEYEGDVTYELFHSLKCEPWQPNITTLINFESKWKFMLEADTPIPTPASVQNRNKVGVYEGGGYLSKGIYRPFIDCSMRSISDDNFCPVCQDAIIRMIIHYSE